MKNHIWLSILLTMMTFYSIAQEGDWTLQKEKDNISVFTRLDKATGSVEFKAVTSVNTNMDKVNAIFGDINTYKNWMADTKVSSHLEQINETESYVYFEAQLPWPFENRDMPLKRETFVSDNKMIILLKGEPSYIPAKKDITRIQHAKGSWKITETMEGLFAVEYQFLADPGFNIPEWILNIFVVDGPFTTLTNLKKILSI